MRYEDIKKPEDMIAYMVDCTLATVERLMTTKKLSKSEFERQCGIAQNGIDFLGMDFWHIKAVIKDGNRALDFVGKESALSYYTKKRNEYWK